jgi:ribonuclease Z
VKWDCKDLVELNRPFLDSIKETLGFSGFTAVPVTHCPHSYAVVIDGTSFGRVVYSGDCRPSHQLAKVGLGADLLIHEATFEDGMEAEATLKRHSTVGEALRVAHDMQAKHVVLTHFSQRYPKIPPTPAQGHGALPIIFAFDYMRLTPHNLLAASAITPALRLLYPTDEVEERSAPSTSNAIAAMSVPGLFARSELL